MNRRERTAIRRHLYIAATWATAEHYARLATWAIREAVNGRTVNFH